MKIRFLPIVGMVLLITACNSLGDTSADASALYETTFSDEQVFDCPVNLPSKVAFIPPEPWPADPPFEGRFWFGDGGLWTSLPENGSWGALAQGEKFWWWSEEFDVAEDETPDLVVTARQSDGNGETYKVSDATNGYHPSFHWAMLIGVELPSPGCWEITGQYSEHELTFVLSVP